MRQHETFYFWEPIIPIARLIHAVREIVGPVPRSNSGMIAVAEPVERAEFAVVERIQFTEPVDAFTEGRGIWALRWFGIEAFDRTQRHART
jgi:hypothetical protein